MKDWKALNRLLLVLIFWFVYITPIILIKQFFFFQVKKIHLHDELFSVEKGLLTPTMKSKRVDLKKYFQKELDELYSNLD